MDAAINSYPTVFALGHRAIQDIFLSSVIVEEKVDGSQFSFGIVKGELVCRSKGKQLLLDEPEKMFIPAITTVRAIEHLLHPGWVYRCEFLGKPKHNVLLYDRIPVEHLIGFDICTGVETYLPYVDKKEEFARIGLETVSLLYEGIVPNAEFLRSLLDTVSSLGGTQVEGVVVKNYESFTIEKKIAVGKFVSERFKEVAGGEWRKLNPLNADILAQLIVRYRTPARWMKAVQHLRDAGMLEDSPRDIGNLMREMNADVLKECTDEIKEILFRHFWPKISRGIGAGLPEWYKQLLLEGAFAPGNNEE